MYCDDRLATVLRASVTGEAAVNTQFRQLLDLLGRAPADAGAAVVERGFARLDELTRAIPADRRAAMLRDPALRLANPRLVARLAEDEPVAAAAAIAAARLDERQWLEMIPEMSVRARGLLRHRRDLGPETAALLARLGVGDLVLTAPEPAAPEPAPAAPPPPEHAENAEIRALLRRIEAFRQARAAQGPAAAAADAPLLPLGGPEAVPPAPPKTFDFATDAAGRVVRADPGVAAMVVGLTLCAPASSFPSELPARLDAASLARMRRHLPVSGGEVRLEGAPAIAGLWRLDAVPRFASAGGGFTGYAGRLRRADAAPTPAEDAESGRIRELLHELRTPVNAIQGFAEIIQQQLFGPAPHEYRALAANIAADAARLLAGFEELDRLARLETGALRLDEGRCDLAGLLAALAAQLEPVMRARNAALTVGPAAGPVIVPLDRADGERLVWRLLATLAGAAAPGEQLALVMSAAAGMARFVFDLPAAMAGQDDCFAASQPQTAPPISAGMFGPGFALRLARSEARAAGGGLAREDAKLILTLPALTATDADRSEDGAAPEQARAT